MKVAITTDWLKSFGGAERVLLELHQMFPDAPVYTSVYEPNALPASMQGWDVRPSFLQKVPFAKRRHDWFLPLMPMAFEQFDLREYDLVVSTNSACAKGVITRPDAVNVCYTYTPCRYIWDLYHEYTAGHRAKAVIAPAAHWLRVWDRAAADRVDHFVAISDEVARRIGKHYRREAEVVYPPVDVEGFGRATAEPGDGYLVVSRLVGYKRVDLAVEACNRLGRPLTVVGEGPERARLEAMAGPTIRFAGAVDDAGLAAAYAGSRAFLFPGHEDFGITPVEAQAAGRPVIAYAAGGALETVEDGVTGLHFEEQTVGSLVDAIVRFESRGWSADSCVANARRFGASRFREELARAIDGALSRAPRLRATSKPALTASG